MRVLRVAGGILFGTFRVEAPPRFRYATVTLGYVYRGAGWTELYPDTMALMHIGSSPLQGLGQSRLLFFNENTGEVCRLNEEPIAIAVQSGDPQQATLVYEFHQDCRDFCLYFPGCEAIVGACS